MSPAVLIHHCPLRTALWQAFVKILKSAEAGDLAIGILEIRKAGSGFVKSYIKDLQWGSKNPVKRLKKIMADDEAVRNLPKALQVEAKDAQDTFIEAQKTMENMMTSTTAWTKHNVQEGVNQTMSASADLQSAHNRIAAVVNSIMEHKATVAKEKQAESRRQRLDAKKAAKCFEICKLPVHWRVWLQTNNLIIDIDMPLTRRAEAAKFGDYQPSIEAEGDDKQDWSAPKWFISGDSGHHCLNH